MNTLAINEKLLISRNLDQNENLYHYFIYSFYEYLLFINLINKMMFKNLNNFKIEKSKIEKKSIPISKKFGFKILNLCKQFLTL
jgi:hypothetical protein